MQDTGCRMWDASLSSQPSSKAGSGEGPLSLRATAGRTQRSLLTQEPGWMEAGAIREISATKTHVFIYIFFKNQETLSPFVRLLGGEDSVGRARRGTVPFSKEEASVSPPCPKSHPGRVRGALGCQPQWWFEGSGPQRLR